MSKPQGFIDFAAVKAATTLEQVLTHYRILSSLQLSGATLRGICPIHKGTNPKQFSATLAKNAWNCFSDCQSGGNHLDFVMKMENCTLREAAWKLNDWFALGLENQRETKPSPRTQRAKEKLPTEKPSAAPHTDTSPPDATSKSTTAEVAETDSEPNPALSFSLDNLDAWHPYLEERGLTPETIAVFGLGYCAKGILSGRIAIPIHNDSGQLVGNAGRWPGEPPDGKEKYRLPAKFRKSLEVFNYHRAAKERPDQPLIVVEGYFGAMRLWQEGLQRVIALMGSSLSQRQEDLISCLVDVDSKILLMLDNDDAGRSAQEKILQRLAAYCYVRVFQYPDDVKQPDDLPEEMFEFLRA